MFKKFFKFSLLFILFSACILFIFINYDLSAIDSIINNLKDFNLFNIIECSTGDSNIPSLHSAEGKLLPEKDNVLVSVSADKTSMNNSPNYTISISQNTVKSIVNGINKIGDTIIPNLGTGATTAAVAGAVAKGIMSQPSIPLVTRTALAAGGGSLTGATVLTVMTGAQTLISNKQVYSSTINGANNLIKSSEHANPDITRVPSPSISSNFDSFNSPLENHELIKSPLESLVSTLFLMDLLLLILFTLILYFIFYKYISTKNIKFVTNLSDRYLPIKLAKFFQKLANSYSKVNEKFIFYMFILICVQVLVLLLFQLYFLQDLYVNIDEYVSVYNYMNNSPNPMIFN